MARYRNVVSGVTVSTDVQMDSEWKTVDGTADEQVGYESQTVDELKAEIDRRNARRETEDQIVPDGTKKADLVAALEADDK